MTEYNKILDSITPEDLNNAIREYFNINKAAITVVHPTTGINDKNISFKGQQRMPIDINDISEYKLNNNYDTGFYNTNSNNINIALELYCDNPYPKKAGVAEVLNEIYSNGLKNVTADRFEEFKDKNNLGINAVSGYDGISVFMNGDKNNYKLGLKTMEALLYNPNITEDNIKTAITKIKDRIYRIEYNSEYLQKQFDNKLAPHRATTIEILDNLDKITVKDIQDYHQYLLNNSRGIVTANIPVSDEKEVKTNILKSVNNLKQVKENNFKLRDLYQKMQIPVVLQVSNYNSQADISESFRFKYDGSIKERAIAPVMNSILSNSSIGLFDILREKENLAYSVHSDIQCVGNQGKVTLNILTTTDNKEIGEQNYDNLQKSINGFNRQISELTNGNFTEEDLEIAKRAVKASLLNNEGNSAKIRALNGGLNSDYGIDLKNKVYAEVNNITKEDVIKFAQKVFADKPVYAIAASQDTLNANKEFLNSLKN